MSDERLQLELLKDLRVLDDHQAEIGSPLVLIGGWAVSCYTTSVRMTRDADFVTLRDGVNAMMGLLKSLGYDCNHIQGRQITANRRVGDDYIKLAIHVAIDGVFDDTTRRRYPMTQDDLKGAERREVKPYFAEAGSATLAVSRVEDLFLMKLHPLRAQDLVDACNLLLECFDSFELERIVEKLGEEETARDFYQSRFHLVAERIRDNGLTIEWQRHLGLHLTRLQQSAILKRLRILAKL